MSLLHSASCHKRDREEEEKHQIHAKRANQREPVAADQVTGAAPSRGSSIPVISATAASGRAPVQRRSAAYPGVFPVYFGGTSGERGRHGQHSLSDSLLLFCCVPCWNVGPKLSW